MSSWWWIFKLLSGQKIYCSRDSEITNYFSRWCNEWITWCHVTPTSVPELTVVSEAPVVSTAPPPSTDKSPPLRRPRPLCCRHGDQWRGGWGRRRRGDCLWCRGRCGGRLQTETLRSHSWGRSPVSSRICLLLLLLGSIIRTRDSVTSQELRRWNVCTYLQLVFSWQTERRWRVTSEDWYTLSLSNNNETQNQALNGRVNL